MSKYIEFWFLSSWPHEIFYYWNKAETKITYTYEMKNIKKLEMLLLQVTEMK